MDRGPSWCIQHPTTRRNMTPMIDQITRITATLILCGSGLALVIFLGTAIIQDLIRDWRGLNHGD